MWLIILHIYFVSFIDKGVGSHLAIGERAIEQRAKWHIPIDSLDYSVSTIYLDSLCRIGADIKHTSRWFNGATVEASAAMADNIRLCSFVSNIELTRDTISYPKRLHDKFRLERTSAENNALNTVESQPQLDLFNLSPLHQSGYEGQGIRMALVDGTFYNANSVALMDSVRERGQLIGYRDFTDDDTDIFGSTAEHGTACWSTVAGLDSNYHGAATKAEYILLRTEEALTESPKEMDNWVAAVEYADSMGVNIISTSLGYYRFDSPAFNLAYSDLDGKTTRCARASLIAARKGILIVTAAGNEGNKDWHYITTPADADSILTVGAVDNNGYLAGFSSRGPSSDNRVKPDVCAMGYTTCVVKAATGELTVKSGTSFACPLVAGMASSLWSALPDADAMDIRERILRSADRYDTPDNSYGYGIPDAWKAFTDSHTALMNNAVDKQGSCKYLENGSIVIRIGDNRYNILGERIY